MKFTNTPPTIDGYYWVVDTSYPIPKPCYVYRYANGETRIHGMHAGVRDVHHCRFIQYGDKIELPNIEDCELE